MRNKKYVARLNLNRLTLTFYRDRAYDLVSLSLLSILSAGCGASSEIVPRYTTVTISGGGHTRTSSLTQVSNYASSLLQRPNMDSLASARMAGGLMVYLQGVQGTTSAYGMYLANETSASSSIQIQNGTYAGFSLGYTGANMTGSMECGFSNSGSPMTFNGAAATVNFNLTYTDCNTFTTYGAGGSNPVLPATLSSCTRVQGPSVTNSQCDTNYAGNLASASIQFRPFNFENNQFNFPLAPSGSVATISSGCLPFSPNTINSVAVSTTSPALQLPLGTTVVPFIMPMVIAGYRTSATCSSAPGFYNFGSNLISGVSQASGVYQMTLPLPAGSNANSGPSQTFSGDAPSYVFPYPSAAPTSVSLLLRDFSSGSGVYTAPSYTFTYSGTAVSTGTISSMAVNSAGNVFITDGGNYIKSGLYTTGTPSFGLIPLGSGYTGLSSIAVDSSSNIYLTASYKTEMPYPGLAKISNTGIFTVLGSLSTSFPMSTSGLPKIAVQSSASGTTVYAVDVASTSPNLHLSVNGGNFNTLPITTGGPTPNNAIGIAVDSSGNIFIIDGNFLFINKNSGSSFSYNSFSGIMPSLQTPPKSIVVDAYDNIYILDSFPNIWKSVNGGSNFIKLSTSNIAATYKPLTLTVDAINGQIYVGGDSPSTGNNYIQQATFTP